MNMYLLFDGCCVERLGICEIQYLGNTTEAFYPIDSKHPYLQVKSVWESLVVDRIDFRKERAQIQLIKE